MTNVMLKKPPECSGCYLEQLGLGFVPPSGTGANQVALVGMAPATKEVEKGEPFVGRAGMVLSRILVKVGKREDFAIWNTIQCQGPNDSLTFKNVENAISHCAVHRDRYRKQFRNQVTVTFGSVPFQCLTSCKTPISKARGYRYETIEGPVVPTYHPAFLGRGKMNLIPVVIWDIETALKERFLPPPTFPLDDLTLYPDPTSFEEWCRQARHSSFLVHDIETGRSRYNDDEEDEFDPSYEILRFSLARDDFKAITAPFQEPFVQMWKELAATEIPKVGWNSDAFDDPREEANGIPMAGKRIDAQWLWHFLQSTLPRGLGHVTTYYDRVPEWKSIGSNQGYEDELYSAMDARETAKCFVGIRKALEARRV